MYRSGIKYNSAVDTNSTKQTKTDKNGTDQLNMLQKIIVSDQCEVLNLKKVIFKIN